MRRVIKCTVLVLSVLMQLQAKDMLLVDTSGSVEPSAQEVKNMVHKYLRTNKNVLAFASKPYFVQEEGDLVFGGGTALSLAFEKVKSMGVDFLIVVTDGMADNPAKAIAMAKKLKNNGVTICGVYVSENLEIPEEFAKIADKTFAVNQFNQAVKHCTDIREDLMGKEATHKTVDADKYLF